MITLTTWEALEAYPHAHTVLSERLVDFRDLPLSDLCRVQILEPGDALPDLLWEYVKHDGGWYELTAIESDDGFGLVVFVPDQPDIDPDVLAFCRAG